MRRFISKLTAVGLAAMIVFAPAIASACPTCKGSLHDNGSALGYAISIVFMMSMPLVIAAFWAVTIWRLRSKMIRTTSATAGPF